ncbi:putative entry exclusion protein TrbK-alt [Novosphingobium jiangmenense]|uniref:Entry exclusion protein TrbK-alt n=1 Tax=Novosphingobium jiangmenense TaxID=2791981 RepID=A0ABS0HHI4_9SPHN|nr:putative entry exclusion protein TrbK-alt [Novosphingobium jiangmenense]MBF9151720.1 putative entry exclusion protein TrbK-alt [Novosphingobium jiangmenense]
MDTKLFARIGAVAFVAIALTMTALQLREEPVAPPPEIAMTVEPRVDPLPATLRQCAASGEQALAPPLCRAAWVEKRRRFLGQAPSDPDRTMSASAMASASAQSQPGIGE